MAAHAPFRVLKRVATWLAVAVAASVLLIFLATGLILHRSPILPVGAEDRTVTVDGLTVRYRQSPNQQHAGPAVILLHGFGGTLAEWDKVAAHMRDTRWIAIDIPGFGGSSRPVARYDLDSQRLRLIQVMDALSIDRAVLAGQSMGASLAALSAARSPDRVAGVVLVAPSGLPGSLRYPFPLSLFYRPGLPNTLVRAVVDNHLFARLFPTSLARQALGVTASYTDAFAEALTTIKAPTVVMWSRGDQRVLFATHDEFVRRIPHAAFIEAPETAGHAVASRHPEGIAAAITELLKREQESVVGSQKTDHGQQDH